MKNVCVITGGGSGMGLETARVMGKNYKVLICGRSLEKLNLAVKALRREGLDVEAMACDVSDVESVKRLAHYGSQLGKVTSVIHCAGLSPHMGTAKQILEINALGTIYVNNAFYEVMEDEGCLIDVSSMSAYLTPKLVMPKWLYPVATTNPELFMKKLNRWVSLFPKKVQSGVAYGISKHFVIWLASREASKFGSKNVRILSISPGNFETPMGEIEKDEADAYIKHCAIKRYGDVKEIASLFEFCSSNAPGYLTGLDIICDGGLIASGVKAMGKRS